MFFVRAPILALLALGSPPEAADPAEPAASEVPATPEDTREPDQVEPDQDQGEVAVGEPRAGEVDEAGPALEAPPPWSPPPRRQLRDAIGKIAAGSTLSSIGVFFVVAGSLVGAARVESGREHGDKRGVGGLSIGLILVGGAGTLAGASLLAIGGSELHAYRRNPPSAARLRVVPGAWVDRQGGGLVLVGRF